MEEPTTANPPLKLYAAMHQARKGMPTIPKTGFNKFDDYHYSTIEDFVTAIQGHLNENGLIVINEIVSEEWLTDRTTSKDKLEHVVRIHLRATVIHVGSGEKVSIIMPGEGQDRGDKAYYKANTGARKYALANLFDLASGDDPETDSPETIKGKGRSEQPRRTVGKAVAPAPESSGVKEAKIWDPPNWPNTDLVGLCKWIDELPPKTSAFEVALGILMSDVNLYSCIADWEPAFNHLIERCRRLIADKTMRSTDSFTAKIKAEFQRLAQIKVEDQQFANDHGAEKQGTLV